MVNGNIRMTYAERFSWVKRQGSSMGQLLNADIYLDKGLEHLRNNIDSDATFLALTHYHLRNSGIQRNDYPHWTQLVWGVQTRAELPKGLIYVSGFALSFPGFDNSISILVWSHSFRIHYPTYHVRRVNLQGRTSHARDTISNRFYGIVNTIHPRQAPSETTSWSSRLARDPRRHRFRIRIIIAGLNITYYREMETSQRFLTDSNSLSRGNLSSA
jgi:hypothetical protein